LSPNSQIVGVHLDLKYQMPGKRYLMDWVRRLPSLGINTLLIEYEDKFPFVRHPFLRHVDAFTPAELRELLAAARGAGLRVAPLLQSLSHLEFALNHEALASLRECPEIPTQICPCNKDAVKFIHDLQDEVMAFHAEDEWFHIGADEAWSLGSCPDCARRAGNDTTALWLEHTAAMCERVRRLGKRPMMWDDAFWKEPSLAVELPSDVLLCSWDYGVTRIAPEQNPARLMTAYERLGREAVGCPCLNWGLLFPRRHTMENTAAWAGLLRQSGRGMINTSWASFHTLLPTWVMQVAATGALMQGVEAGAEWEADFLAGEFGVRVAGLPDALAALGEMWEVPIEGLKRPITLPLHACMDMVLHYPGGQEERKQRGGYPLNMEEIDFTAMYRRKLELLRGLPDARPIHEKLDCYLGACSGAVSKLSELAGSAQRRREEAALFLALGELKLVALRALSLHLRHDLDPASVLRDAQACRSQLERLLPQFVEPSGCRLLLRMWCKPIQDALDRRSR